MNFRAIAVPLLISWLVAQPAAARPLNFDCDVPADRYSQISQDAEDMLAISGTVTPMIMRSGNNLPVAGGRLVSPDEKISAGFQLVAETAGTKQFTIVLNTMLRGTARRAVVGTIPAGQISFRLALAPDGKVSLAINGTAYSADLAPLPAGRLMAFCSTGQFKFTDLKFSNEADGLTSSPAP